MRRYRASIPNADLVIDHARLTGIGECWQLRRALGDVSIDGLGIARHEYLLIPKLAVRERLTANGPNRFYARSVTRELRVAAESAALNPCGKVALERPVRFSSRARLAAWLLGNTREADGYRHALAGVFGDADSLGNWIRRVVLPDAAVLSHCVKALFQNSKLTPFLKSLQSADLRIVEQGIERAYNISVESLHTAARGRCETTASAYFRRSEIKAPAQLAADIAGYFRTNSADKRTQVVIAALLWFATFPAMPRGKALKRFIINATAPMAETRPQKISGAPMSGRGAQSSAAKHISGHEWLPHLGPRQSQSPSPRTDRPGRPQPNGPLTAIKKTPISAASTGSESTNPSPKPDLEAANFDEGGDTAEGGTYEWPCADAIFSSPYCGLLFLTNALRQLGFTQDIGIISEPGLALPPFRLIDQLGIWWFRLAYKQSPLHQWLGREAAQLSLPRRFVHPEIQASKSALCACQILRDGRHKTVWHRDGYPLLDWPQTASQRAMIAKLGATAFSHGRICRAGADKRLPQTLQYRWIGALAKTIEAEFRSRSGEYQLNPEDLALAGTVQIVDAAITVFFDLSDLPFAVRFAGLDRDPGWIQPEGRSLVFSYQ